MFEMMVDLETEDTKPSAIVLSIGAVVWESLFNPAKDELEYRIVERFLRIPSIEEQRDRSRSSSPHTIKWWGEQDMTAYQEAYNPVRQPCVRVLEQFREFSNQFAAKDNSGINAYWASPATFDFPIWEDFAMTFRNYVPWHYRQKYDVRTVVREARYSVRDHDYSHLVGLPHTPVYDCEAQIDLLTAARNKLNRRSGVAFGPRVAE